MPYLRVYNNIIHTSIVIISAVILPCIYFVGNKADIIRKLKDHHIEFLLFISRNLSPPDLQFVDLEFRKDISIEAIASQRVALIEYPGNYNVELKSIHIHQLKLAQPLSSHLMSAVWAMFAKRDARICNAHREVNSSGQFYHVYKSSLFLREGFFRALEENYESPSLVSDFFPPGINFVGIHRVYCLVQPSQEQDNYSLVIFDIEKKCFFVLYSDWEASSLPQHLLQRNTILSIKLNGFLNSNAVFDGVRGNNAWVIKDSFGKMKFPPNQTDFDSGIYVFLFAYFAVNDCPIIFNSADILRIRKLLAYWLLNEYFPM